jgi:hypothetical protein
MAMFKVTASKLETPKDFNPFKMKLSESNIKYPLIIKTWEFEAKSKDECKRLFNEAKSEGVCEVFGFKLENIEKMPNAELRGLQ